MLINISIFINTTTKHMFVNNLRKFRFNSQNLFLMKRRFISQNSKSDQINEEILDLKSKIDHLKNCVESTERAISWVGFSAFCANLSVVIHTFSH